MFEFFESSNSFYEIDCYFCFQTFEVFLETAGFQGKNSEIIDCTVCCNPNKIEYECRAGKITSLIVSDGNA